ncbi:MAG: hypothetical protein Q9177_006826 [Variospora cf. flavescens]
MHGNTIPIVAARFIQLGAALPVVARAREVARDLYDDGLDLAGRAESHALEERAAECTAGGLEAGRSAVDAGEVGVGVSAEGEFAV